MYKIIKLVNIEKRYFMYFAYNLYTRFKVPLYQRIVRCMGTIFLSFIRNYENNSLKAYIKFDAIFVINSFA